MGCLTVARIQPARVGVQRSHTNATARRTHHGGLGNSSFVSHPQWRTSRAREISCNGLFGLGAPEIAVIVGVVALIYGTFAAVMFYVCIHGIKWDPYICVGPSKLPELGKGLGKTAKSFQSAAKVRCGALYWWRLQLFLFAIYCVIFMFNVSFCTCHGVGI